MVASSSPFAFRWINAPSFNFFSMVFNTPLWFWPSSKYAAISSSFFWGSSRAFLDVRLQRTLNATAVSFKSSVVSDGNWSRNSSPSSNNSAHKHCTAVVMSLSGNFRILDNSDCRLNVAMSLESAMLLIVRMLEVEGREMREVLNIR